MPIKRWLLLLAAVLVAAPVFAQDPDTDGDGIPDSVDLCPRQPGPRDNRGCPLLTATPAPDSDSDGLPDNVDACPTQPGPRENGGCPASAPPPSDRDGDGTPDDRDACPDQGGPDWNRGCPASAPQPTRPPYRPAPPPDTQNCYATPASENNVNVREQPTTQGRILRGLAPNTHLLVLDASINPQGQTWFQVQVPEGLAFVADSAVVVQGNCANLPGVTLVPQAGQMPTGLCFIDPAKVAGDFNAGVLDDLTTVPNPQQANPETGNLFLNAAVVTVGQPATATFLANPVPQNVPWASSVTTASFMRVTVYTSSFQQVTYQEVPLGQPVIVDLPAGDYYWQFQFDTAGATLTTKCQPQAEQTAQATTPICALFEATASGELINPRRIDQMPLVDGQDQPNEAGAFVLEYPFVVYEDILLRVMTMSYKSSVKAMVFIPSVQLYQSETTIPNGGYADIAIPQGVYTLEFVSATPFDVQALCWPGNTPPEVMGTPEPSAEVGDAIGFIIGDCVAATGFEPNGMPQNPHTFSPMDPLTLDYAPNAQGQFSSDIKYLIVNVPSQLFFSLQSNQTTMDLYVYDIANGGVVFNLPYATPGNHAVSLPVGVYYVSFTSSLVGRAVVNCLPTESTSAGSPFDIPEFNGPLTDLLGVPTFGFEPFASTPSNTADGSAVLLTPPDPSLPSLLITLLGDGSVRVEQPPRGGFELVFGDGSVEPSPERPTLVLNTGLLLGDGSVLPNDLFACDGSVRVGDLQACDGSVRPQMPIAGDGSVMPIIGVVLGFQALGGTLEEPANLGAIVLQTPDPAFKIGDLAGGVSFGAPNVENLALQPEACEVIPAKGSGCPLNPQTGMPSPSCMANQAAQRAASTVASIQGNLNNIAPDFDASSDQKSFVMITKPMQVNRPARVTAELVQNLNGGPVNFDLSGIAVSVQAFRADGGWFTQVNVGQAAASVDIPTGPYTHFRGAVVRLGPPVAGDGDLKLRCEAR